VSPKKKKPKLGQHWLEDPKILQKIASYLNLTSTDFVIEVGPGLGTLTSKLLKSQAQVLAVEFDPKLAENLPKSFHKNTRLKVVNSDIRSFNFEELPKEYKLATNLPYYISGLFFRILTDTKNKPVAATILVQKEVAQKIATSPESGHSNKLAMLVNYFYQTSLGISVPPKAFNPPPKVDSMVINLHLRPEPLFPKIKFKDYARLVKISFSSPRKTIINNLAAGLQLPKKDLQEDLAKLKINPETRAEDLSLEQWSALFQKLESKDL
jgi:16S rRNA (adenine1518-N6/adenine1519-N6)-dimethyltransferase